MIAPRQHDLSLEKKNTTTILNDDVPHNLFDVLPFRDLDISEEESKPYVVMTYLPDGTFHKIKRACDKATSNQTWIQAERRFVRP